MEISANLRRGSALDTNLDKLEQAAVSVKSNSYCRYSNFQVGCSILTKSGKIFAGCNVENASYPSGICAEQNAIGSMIAAGERDIDRVVITSNDTNFTYPCGLCRQSLREFCDVKETKLVFLTIDGKKREHTFEELLPFSFGPEDLEGFNKN